MREEFFECSFPLPSGAGLRLGGSVPGEVRISRRVDGSLGRAGAGWVLGREGVVGSTWLVRDWDRWVSGVWVYVQVDCARIIYLRDRMHVPTYVCLAGMYIPTLIMLFLDKVKFR